MPPPPETGGEGSAPNPDITFVTEENRDGVRSHAMREHWKRRRHILTSHGNKRSQRTPRQILPNPGGIYSEGTPSAPNSISSATVSSQPSDGSTDSLPAIASDMPTYPNTLPDEDRSAIIDGIPSQALSGMNLALSCSRLDPFDKFPIKLTVQHHKLLHHCKPSKKPCGDITNKFTRAQHICRNDV